MKNCTYKIKIQRNGKEEIIELRNEAELDVFLKENDYGKNWVAKVNSPELIFSIDPQQQAITKLDEITNVVKTRKVIKKNISSNDEENVDFEDIEYVIENTMGVLDSLTHLKQPGKTSSTLCPAFDEDKIKRKRIENFQAQGWANSQTEAEEMFETEKQSWEFYRKAGEEVHDIFQSVISNTQEKPRTILSDTLASQVRKQAIDFINSIHSKYGKNAKILSEFSIMSKELDPDVQTMLEHGAKVDAFSGRIDMLVIDEKGNVHVYDFKISRKDPGNWNETYNAVIEKGYWSSAKKISISYQMAFYNAILRQYGITPTSINIVPIHIDIKYNDSHELNASEVTGVKINQTIENPAGTLSGSFLENAMYYIPSNPDFKELKKVQEKYQKLIPSKSIDTQVRHFVADVNYYRRKEGFVHYVPKDDEKSSEYRFYFYKKGIGAGKKVYCKDEEDLMRQLGEYVNKINNKNGIELVQLGYKIKDAISGKVNWRDIGVDFQANAQKAFIANQFQRYIQNKWYFHQDETANAAGIFVFSKNGRSEIVMMTEKPLLDIIEMRKGRSILGDYYEDFKWDRTRWLAANNGNLKMMQALCYVSENQEYFLANKIGEIRCINPWHTNEVSALNSLLIDNFRRLNAESKAGIELNGNCFLDDITALVQSADDRFKMLDLSTSFCIIDEARNESYTQEWLLRKIAGLRNTYKDLNDSNTYDAKNPAWQVLTYLTKAYMKIQGYQVFNENDPGDWITEGWKIMGLRTTSGQNSPSANMRMLYKLINQYSTDVRQETLKVIAPVQKAFNDFFEEKGKHKILGGEFKYFEEWFEKDEKGNIAKSFLLVDPYDPSVKLSDKSRHALKMFLNSIAYLQHPDMPAEEMENYRHTLEYRQVPILERRFGRRFTKNPWQALKSWFKQNKTLYEDVFMDQDSDKQEWYKNDLDQEKLFNRFVKYNDPNIREEVIKEYGVDALETDLERVFNEVAQAYTKASVSKKYLPAINGFKLAIKYAEQAQGNNLENTYKAVLDSINKKIYGNPIMQKQLQPIYGALSGIRSTFSVMTLGLSSKAFAREMLQGFWTGLSRAGVQQMPGITLDTYTKAFMTILQDAPKNKDLANKFPQLNEIYGMANYSLNDIADQQRINWYGIRNWTEQTLYITSSSPDFQHRLAILVAKMMGDGCYEASMEMGPDGKLKYNFKKDKRYTAYINNDFKNPEYIYQKALYLENLRQFNKEGWNLKEGDDLPLAYTNRQILQIKQHSDLLYGHYDQESKALINDSFLGSFFMQFRTWAIAGIERWFLAPGVYNGEEPKLQKTEDGEEIWYWYDSEEDGDEIKRNICRKSEVPEEAKKKGLAAPLYQFEGNPIEGIFFSALRFTKALMTWDKEKIQEVWNDPLLRKNFKLGLWDTFIMGMFVLLIRALFGLITDEDLTNNLTSQNWITQWTYGVLTGSTQDGQIHQILGSMFTDLNPPLVGQLQRFAESTWGVITGDDNIAYAITRNIGAVREFSGFAKQLSE